MPAKRKFGNIRSLPSGRYQARYTDPLGTQRKAPVTFDARIDAEAWLVRIRTEIVQGTWLPKTGNNVNGSDLGKQNSGRIQSLTFGEYAASWLATRQLAATTRDHYAQVLRDHLTDQFAREQIDLIT